MTEADKKQLNYTEEKFLYEENGYSLYEEITTDGMSDYIVYDSLGNYIGEFEDLSSTENDRNNFKDSYLYDMYLSVIEDFEKWGLAYKDDGGDSWYNKSYSLLGLNGNDRWDDDDYTYKPKEKTPEEIQAEKDLVESLCKSDTIVFHQTDSTTVMLDPVYEGKGFDVYKGSMWGGELGRDSIHELIKRHDRVVCLGHGTSHGLLSGVIGVEEVPLLKDKKIFSMWCYAATFWKNNGFTGHGILTSDNFPSEVWEARSACNAEVGKEWIYDNMVLAGEIAGKAMDIAWTNPQAGCDLFRKEYSEQSKINTEDERKVVEFNTNSMQVV